MPSHPATFDRLMRLARAGDRDAARALTQQARRRGDELALLLALAAGEPGADAWVELCDIIDRAGPDRREALVARLSALLRDWGEPRPAPTDWVVDCLDRRPHPQLGLVTAIAVRGLQVGDDGIVALARSPELRRLERLALVDVGLTGAGVTELATAPALARLRDSTSRTTTSAIAARTPSPRARTCASSKS